MSGRRFHTVPRDKNELRAINNVPERVTQDVVYGKRLCLSCICRSALISERNPVKAYIRSPREICDYLKRGLAFTLNVPTQHYG